MVVSRDVARARFAAFVKRALRDARTRGMTDQDIQRVTGVGQSTFHRWQKGEGAQLPTIDRVRAFCAGLDIPLRPALIALGIDEQRQATPPVEDPDLSRIARVLADPNVSEDQKQVIRNTIRMLARAARAEVERID